MVTGDLQAKWPLVLSVMSKVFVPVIARLANLCRRPQYVMRHQINGVIGRKLLDFPTDRINLLRDLGSGHYSPDPRSHALDRVVTTAG